MREEVVARFEQMKWCDLSLLNMRTERHSDTDDLVIGIVQTYSSDKPRLQVRFKDTTYLSMTVDFASKRACADAFGGGPCLTESPWKKSIIDSNPYDNFDDYLHFELGLIPNGGLLNLLALDFECSEH